MLLPATTKIKASTKRRAPLNYQGNAEFGDMCSSCSSVVKGLRFGTFPGAHGVTRPAFACFAVLARKRGAGNVSWFMVNCCWAMVCHGRPKRSVHTLDGAVNIRSRIIYDYAPDDLVGEAFSVGSGFGVRSAE